MRMKNSVGDVVPFILEANSIEDLLRACALASET